MIVWVIIEAVTRGVSSLNLPVHHPAARLHRRKPHE
jgi:hypothetical protein